MLHCRRYWHTEGKTELSHQVAFHHKTPTPKQIVRVNVLAGITCTSHLPPTRFPFQIKKYTTYPKCKCLILFSWWFLCIAAGPPKDKSEEDLSLRSLSYNLLRHWNNCQYGKAGLCKANKGRGQRKSYCATCCFGHCWFSLFLLQPLPRAYTVLGMLPLQQALSLLPNPS